MEQPYLPAPRPRADRWLIRTFLVLALFLVASSYCYRLLVTDQHYLVPGSAAHATTLVQTQPSTR